MTVTFLGEPTTSGGVIGWLKDLGSQITEVATMVFGGRSFDLNKCRPIGQSVQVNLPVVALQSHTPGIMFGSGSGLYGATVKATSFLYKPKPAALTEAVAAAVNEQQQQQQPQPLEQPQKQRQDQQQQQQQEQPSPSGDLLQLQQQADSELEATAANTTSSGSGVQEAAKAPATRVHFKAAQAMWQQAQVPAVAAAAVALWALAILPSMATAAAMAALQPGP